MSFASWVLRCRFLVSAVGYRVSGFGYRASAIGYRVSGLGLRVSLMESRVSGLGSRVSRFGVRVPGGVAPVVAQVDGFCEVFHGDHSVLSGIAFSGIDFGYRVFEYLFRVSRFEYQS